MGANKSFLRRRFLAFLVDWLCLALVFLPLGFAARAFARSVAAAVAFMVVGFGLLGLFILRDRLFDGRGIGKRLLGLRLINPNTGGIPTLRQSAVKGLCLCIYPVDAICLLVTGRSLGERLACVQVVDGAEVVNRQPAPQTTTQEETAVGNPARRVLAVCLGLGIVLFSAVAWLAGSQYMEQEKERESYQLAYQYLLDTLTQEDGDEPNIILNSRSYRASGQCQEVGEITTERYTFLVGLDSYTVVCHAQDESWYVCTVCTDES